MKIVAYNPTQSVEELETLLKNEGISENRLSGALGASFLPKVGKFENFAIDGDDAKDDGNGVKTNSTKHVRIGTKNMLDSISLSRLQINLHVGNPTVESLLVSAKGNYYLPGNTIVNPGLQGNQANVIKKLIGKHFVASEVNGVGTNFKAEGFKSPDEITFRPVKTYKIELFDTKVQAEAFAATL